MECVGGVRVTPEDRGEDERGEEGGLGPPKNVFFFFLLFGGDGRCISFPFIFSYVFSFVCMRGSGVAG